MSQVVPLKQSRTTRNDAVVKQRDADSNSGFFGTILIEFAENNKDPQKYPTPAKRFLRHIFLYYKFVAKTNLKKKDRINESEKLWNPRIRV